MNSLTNNNSMKIGFDPVIISSRVYEKCTNNNCTVDNLCTNCVTVNTFLCFPMILQFPLRLTMSTHLFREFNPGWDYRPASTMYQFACLYSGILFANQLNNSERQFGHAKTVRWNKIVHSQREQADKLWKVNFDSYQKKFEDAVKNPETTDLELMRIMEERLYEAMAIYDLVTGDYMNQTEDNCWYADTLKTKLSPTVEDGMKWYMERYGTRSLVTWTKEMSTCLADKIEEQTITVEKYNKRREEFLPLIKERKEILKADAVAYDERSKEIQNTRKAKRKQARDAIKAAKKEQELKMLENRKRTFVEQQKQLVAPPTLGLDKVELAAKFMNMFSSLSVDQTPPPPPPSTTVQEEQEEEPKPKEEEKEQSKPEEEDEDDEEDFERLEGEEDFAAVSLKTLAATVLPNEEEETVVTPSK